jgi:hypothetical protein
MADITETATNPVLTTGDDHAVENVLASAAADMEAALAGLDDPGRAAEVLQRQLDLMEVRFEAREVKLRAELRSAAPFEDAVRASVARLTETPTNWHQGTVYYLGCHDPQDAKMKAKAPMMFAGGVIMVLAQVVVAGGLFIGANLRSCRQNDQCDKGSFCAADDARCHDCGGQPAVPMQIQGTCIFDPSFDGNARTIDDPTCMTWNAVSDPNFVGFNTTLVMRACTDPSASEILGMTAVSVDSGHALCVDIAIMISCH